MEQANAYLHDLLNYCDVFRGLWISMNIYADPLGVVLTP